MRSLSLIIALILTAACSRQAPHAYLSGDIESQTSIIGGEAVKSTDFARSATVAVYTTGRRGLEFLCTGTLISQNLVVTAAHCMQSVYTIVYVSFGEELPKSTLSMTRVEEFISHPDYGTVQKPGEDQSLYWTTEHDIALLKLNTPAPEGFNPVAIHADTDKIPLQSKLLLAGFGTTNDEKGTAALSMNQVEVSLDSLVDDYLVIDQTEYKGACFGDSGGPAYLKTAQGWVVVGATHAARPGFFDCHHKSDYTSLSKYGAFIQSIAVELRAEAPVFVTPVETFKRPVRPPIAIQ
ncbi:S1 family peptidase [Bdellovibrio sp. HCB185ZH]|uniref:S1 family peptidase n=1 Tax=Bdellovibrio sp. HCB185ZH TaxID=3394235 RepID=UPI0039A56025